MSGRVFRSFGAAARDGYHRITVHNNRLIVPTSVGDRYAADDAGLGVALAVSFDLGGRSTMDYEQGSESVVLRVHVTKSGSMPLSFRHATSRSKRIAIAAVAGSRGYGTATVELYLDGDEMRALFDHRMRAIEHAQSSLIHHTLTGSLDSYLYIMRGMRMPSHRELMAREMGN